MTEDQEKHIARMIEMGDYARIEAHSRGCGFVTWCAAAPSEVGVFLFKIVFFHNEEVKQIPLRWEFEALGDKAGAELNEMFEASYLSVERLLKDEARVKLEIALGEALLSDALPNGSMDAQP